jgi:hypothetical protein
LLNLLNLLTLLTRPRSTFCLLALFAAFPSLLSAQAKYTAARTADLQIGVNFVGGTSDYAGRVTGVGLYTTFDFSRHFGGEFDLHQGNTGVNQVYERTYEIGGRYYRNYGRVTPYIKAMVGRGVLNYPFGEANLAYNLVAVGGGADVRVLRFLNVRGDYEGQFWPGFQPHGLTPQLFTIGVAYHFPGGLGRLKHY